MGCVFHAHITPCTTSEAALRQQASACMVAQRLAVVNRRLRAFCFSPPAPAGGAQLKGAWFRWWLLLGKAKACGPGSPLQRFCGLLAAFGGSALFRSRWSLNSPPTAPSLAPPGLVAFPPVLSAPGAASALGAPPLWVPPSLGGAVLGWLRPRALGGGCSFVGGCAGGAFVGRRGLGRRRLRAASVRLSCHRLPRRSRTLRAAGAVFHP